VIKITHNPDESQYLIVPPPPGGKRSLLFLLMANVPVQNTLQVQAGFFNKPINPPTWRNLIFIPTTDTPDSLRNDVEFNLSYFIDKGKGSNIIHSLSLKDGRPYADDIALPYYDETHPDQLIITDATKSDSDGQLTPVEPPTPQK
jgi:hypothetical protein